MPILTQIREIRIDSVRHIEFLEINEKSIYLIRHIESLKTNLDFFIYDEIRDG